MMPSIFSLSSLSFSSFFSSFLTWGVGVGGTDELEGAGVGEGAGGLVSCANVTFFGSVSVEVVVGSEEEGLEDWNLGKGSGNLKK